METAQPTWKHFLRFITRILVFSLGFFVFVGFPYVVIHALISIDLILLGVFIFQIFLYTFAIEHVAEEILDRIYSF